MGPRGFSNGPMMPFLADQMRTIKKQLLCNGIGTARELCDKQLNDEAFQLKIEATARMKAEKVAAKRRK